jgi:acyl-CoA thioester hydrolase
MDDVLTIETRPVSAGGASLDLAQRVMRGEEVLVSAQVKVACVGAGRARRIPPALRKAMRLPD